MWPFNKKERNTSQVGSIDDQWKNLFGVHYDFIYVDEKSVLGLPPVQKILKNIVDTISVLPIKVYRTPVDTDTPEIVRNSVTRLLLRSRAVLRATLRDYVLRGRGLIYVVRDEFGQPTEIYNLPIRYTRITQVNYAGGFAALSYRFGANNVNVDLSPAQVIDLVQLPTNQGVDWSDPIKDNADIFKYAICIQAYAQGFFNLGGAIHVLESPEATTEAAKGWVSKFKDLVTVAIKNKIPIIPIPAGASLKAIGANPNDALLIEAQKSSRIMLADVFNMHPAIIGQEGASGTISAEQLQNLYLTQTLVPIVEELENALSMGLWRDTRHKVQFDTTQISRGSIREMAEASARYIQSGIKTPNEVRAEYYLVPKDGGNQLYAQEQIKPLAGRTNDPTPASNSNLLDGDNQDDEPQSTNAENGDDEEGVSARFRVNGTKRANGKRSAGEVYPH